MNTAPLLFELRTEEIPASYIEPSLKQFKLLLLKALEENLLNLGDNEDISLYATSKRICLTIKNFPLTQLEKSEVIKGPPVRVALKDGKATPALTGFLKKTKQSSADAFSKEIIKGQEYFTFKQNIGGKESQLVLPEIFLNILKNLSFPKKMHWADLNFLYPRPITGILFLLGSQTINIEVAGIQSKPESAGHFLLSPDTFSVSSTEEYFKKLEENFIILNQTERRDKIKTLLTSTAKENNLSLVEDEALLDTVNYLVEYPGVQMSEFSEHYLEVPEPVLISEMREHQKYFALKTSDGKLANKFLVVCNIPANDFVKNGNHRVLQARLEDGRFYYKEDRLKPLSAGIDKLKKILYQKELGTIFEKLERVNSIALDLNIHCFDSKFKEDIIKRAVFLAKADLSTNLVMEFPKLQGVIGDIYARLDGEPAEVCNAIVEHYHPVFQGDKLPASDLGLLVSLADKLETLLGAFSIGQRPGGSADPLALRRQTLSIIAILLHIDKSFNLINLLEKWESMYKGFQNKTKAKAKSKKSRVEQDTLSLELWDFIKGRATTIFKDRGLRPDFIQAVINIDHGFQLGNLPGLFLAGEHFNEISKTGDFEMLLASFKRMANILKSKNNASDSDSSENTINANSYVDTSLFEKQAEKDLHQIALKLNSLLETLAAKRNYREIFEHLRDAKPVVDSFFDSVMVMADDPGIRVNRIALLSTVVKPLSSLIDFSRIEIKK